MVRWGWRCELHLIDQSDDSCGWTVNYTHLFQRRSHVFDLDAAAAEWMNELGLKDGFGGAKDKADKDALWVGEFTDSLTIAIALREWNKAVSLVEEGESKRGPKPQIT